MPHNILSLATYYWRFCNRLLTKRTWKVFILILVLPLRINAQINCFQNSRSLPVMSAGQPHYLFHYIWNCAYLKLRAGVATSGRKSMTKYQIYTRIDRQCNYSSLWYFIIEYYSLKFRLSEPINPTPRWHSRIGLSSDLSIIFFLYASPNTFTNLLFPTKL